MRAVRVVFDLESILHTSLMQNALNSVSWDFRGIINQQAGDLLIMCECISLNSHASENTKFEPKTNQKPSENEPETN